MVVFHQVFHKIVYFQLILCAFLFHLNEDTVLCSTLYHESQQGLQSNASIKHLAEKPAEAIIDSTGKHKRDFLSYPFKISNVFRLLSILILDLSSI